MVFFAAAALLILHTLFWGAGLAMLATPRHWRRYWPVFVPILGLTLQATVVWLGVVSGLPGTNSYARASELLPAILLAVGLLRHRRTVAADLRRFAPLALLMAVVLVVTVWPLATASDTLTTSSLGSCDAADYAAGARVMREFSRHDRHGFIGLTDVVKLESVDNFFDHWIRLNHFAPSALIAHHCSVFGWKSFQVISVFTNGLLVLSLPVVFWLARSGLRHTARASFIIATLYGFSSLLLYAVYHVAIGQLLGAQAIALLTWVGIVAARSRLTRSARIGLGILAFTAFAQILASYHFIIVVALAPAGVYALAHSLLRRDRAGFLGWLGLMGAALLCAAVLYAERVLGLEERARLFRQIDFGWPIPPLTPEGWLGIVSRWSLNPHDLWARVLISTLLVVLCVWALWRNPRGKSRPWRLATLCAILPVLAGYGFLQWRGAAFGTNASYDGYKLFTVFYPGLLAGFVMWFRLPESWNFRGARAALYGAAGLLLAGNLFAAASMWQRMRAPRLIVNESLAELRQLGHDGTIESVNLITGDVWSRLWANAMLMHLPQFFPADTYEGRRATELRGSLDIIGRVCRFEHPDSVPIGNGNPPFFLLQDTSAPGFLRVNTGEGWYDIECNYHTNERSRWTAGDAALLIDNPTGKPQRVTAELDASALDRREIEVVLEDEVLLQASASPDLQSWATPEFEVQPGRTVLHLRSSEPPVAGPSKDSRMRSLQVRRFAIKPADPVAP